MIEDEVNPLMAFAYLNNNLFIGKNKDIYFVTFSLFKRIIPSGIHMTAVEMISTIKLIPITPKIKKAPMFGNASLTPLSKKGRKNNKQTIEKMPVLMIGTKRLAIIKPIRLFLFLNNLKSKPATRPAIVHFNKHAITVPIGLIGIKIAIVDGDNKTIRPLKNPSTAPDKGPYKTAPKTTVTSDKLILTGPICR